MEVNLQKIFDEAKPFEEVQLGGEIKLDVLSGVSFFAGNICSKNFIIITKPNLRVEGRGAEIKLEINEELPSDVNLFYIASTAKNVQINNLKIVINLNCPASLNKVTAINNFAYGVKLINCHIEIISQNQANLVGVSNNGNLCTHLETRADNFVIDNSFIKTQVINGGSANSETYGVVNNLANSISVQNSFVYSYNIGIGENQKAVGIFTNGRFGRFIGNNIKANCNHNVGKLKEQAFSFGFINEGLYSIIASNNIVGEWGGQCVGLENKGNFAKVNGNKILSTHTVKGCSVKNNGTDCIFDGNIIVSTSLNPRLFIQLGKNCIITNNLFEGLLSKLEFKSSCGIYDLSEEDSQNIIESNIIKNVCDCGIFSCASLSNPESNVFVAFDNLSELRKTATKEDERINSKLDEKNIESINDVGD